MADAKKHGGGDDEFREGQSARGKGYPGPSTGAPPGAIEGSIMEEEGENEKKRTEGSPRHTTGAGAEAAEGIHATEGRNQHAKSAVTDKRVGRDGSGIRAGSEPIDREQEHKGSYGGEGGKPRTGSQERERH